MQKEFIRERSLLLRDIKPDFLLYLIDKKAVIAGGALTSIFSSRKINDYDLYFPSLEIANEVCNHLKKDHSFKLIFESENAVLFKHEETKQKFQVILCYFYNEEDIPSVYNLFDFTVCMAAYSFEMDAFYFHERFLCDLAQQRIYFSNKSPYPINALYRVKKYISKGFSIAGSELVKIALAIQALKIRTILDLKKHLMGIDTVLIKSLLTDMNMKDDEKYDYNIFIENLLLHIDETYNKLFEDE